MFHSILNVAFRAKNKAVPDGIALQSIVLQEGVCALTHSSFLDTGFLTGEITQVEDTGTTHGTTLVDVDLLDEGAADGEDTFHANAVGNLADSKGLSSSSTTALYHNALEVLDTFFVSFTDFIVNSDGIASFELGESFALDLVFYELD